MYRFTQRSPITVILLSIITCGIYFIYWLYTTSAEINEALGRQEINTTLMIVFMILSYICFPFAFYTWYVMYKISSAMEELGQRTGVNTQSSFVLWIVLTLFFGVGNIIMMYQVQSDINRLGGGNSSFNNFNNMNQNVYNQYNYGNANQGQPYVQNPGQPENNQNGNNSTDGQQ